MTTRRPQLPRELLDQRQKASMIPGTVGGQIASARALPTSSRLRAYQRTTLTGAPVLSAVAWEKDDFTAAGGAQSLTLSYTPQDRSVDLTVAAKRKQEGTDYTVSGNTISLLAAGGAVAGDWIEAHYTYFTAAPNPPTSADLPSGVLAWEASSLLGVVADGGAVTSWTDDTGAYTLSKQGTGTATFHASGGPNGGPYISFDGGVYFKNDTTYPATMANVFQLLKANATTWPAPDSAMTGGCFARDFFDLNARTSLVYHENNVLVSRNGVDFTDLSGNYDMAPINTWFVAECNHASTPTAASSARIGGEPQHSGVFYNGLMAATVWSTGVLSTADRDSVYRWFNSRYGMSCTLP